NGVAGKLVQGWNLSGVTTVQNGLPLTLIDGSAGTAFNVAGTTVQSGYSRPQMAPGKTYADIATPGDVEQRLGGSFPGAGPGYFNASAFTGTPAISPDGTLTT